MAYTTPRTWTAGAVLTAAQLNVDVRDNQLAAFPLGIDAWTAYTPTLTQSGAVTKTVTYAKYQRVGRMIKVNVLLACTGAGTAGNSVLVGLPVTAATAGNIACGSGYIFDASAGLSYAGIAVINTTSVIAFQPTTLATASFLGVAGFTAALASGDGITFCAIYEAAT